MITGPQSFRWLMEGLRLEQKTAIRKGYKFRPNGVTISLRAKLAFLSISYWQLVMNYGKIHKTIVVKHLSERILCDEMLQL